MRQKYFNKIILIPDSKHSTALWPCVGSTASLQIRVIPFSGVNTPLVNPVQHYIITIQFGWPIYTQFLQFFFIVSLQYLSCTWCQTNIAVPPFCHKLKRQAIVPHNQPTHEKLTEIRYWIMTYFGLVQNCFRSRTILLRDRYAAVHTSGSDTARQISGIL